MALETSPSELGNCGRCGQRYRMPRWGREYSCAGCGQPLAGGARGPAVRPQHILLAIGILAAAGIGMRVVADRIYYAPATTVPMGAVRQPVTLPPSFETRLREKIRLLAYDLRADPPPQLRSRLLARQVECYLALTALKPKERRRGTEDLALATRVVHELRALDPEQAALLEVDIAEVEQLEWAPPDAAAQNALRRAQPGPPSTSISGVGQGMGGPGAGGAGPGAGPTAGYPGLSGGGGITGSGAPGYPSGPARGPSGGDGGSARSLMPPLYGPAGNAPTAFGGGDLAAGPPPQPRPSPAQMPVTGPRRADSGSGERSGRGVRSAPGPVGGSVVPNTRPQLDGYVQALRTRLRTANDDGVTAVQLGQALEHRAQIALRQSRSEGGDWSSAARPHYLEAARVYAAAAEKARLRVHRGTYYSHAADVYVSLRDHEMQYRMRRKAVEAVPFDPAFWSDLQRAAQLTGREKETYEARQRHREWLFPVLQARREP